VELLQNILEIFVNRLKSILFFKKVSLIKILLLLILLVDWKPFLVFLNLFFFFSIDEFSIGFPIVANHKILIFRVLLTFACFNYMVRLKSLLLIRVLIIIIITKPTHFRNRNRK